MTAPEDALGLLVGSRDLADRLLAATTLRHLAAAPLDELERLMPKRAAARFHAALAIARAALLPERPARLETTEDAVRHLSPYLLGRETERMVVVACDARGRPMATEVVAEGSPVSVSIRLADLFAPAVRHRAPAILIAHNHPADDPSPSESDRVFTERAIAGGLLLGIEVIDHLILAGGLHASLRAEGGIESLERAIVLP